MIVLDSISKKLGTKVLFENVTVSFNQNERYGLTGPNGAGKSTLLKILMGIIPPDQGTITLPDRVGYLKQDIDQFKNFTALETVIMGNQPLWDAMSKKELLYEQEMTDEIGMQLAELEEIVADENGYSAETDAEILLDGMGIAKECHEQKMKNLPTDWQFRVLLCQALFGNPQALLLDEPTNHLDLTSISWLENFLKQYQGVLVVVSHNRHFLNTITTQTADIDYETVIIYPGNYDQMVITKTSVRKKSEEENKAKEKKIAQLKTFVSRFGAGTRASQVQSRLREIEKLQPQDLMKSNIQKPFIQFTLPDTSSGKVPIKAVELSKNFDDKKVINHFSYEILKGDKIAVIGNNGKGKTTLLKLLANALKPDEGEVIYGHKVHVGYFPQEHNDVIDKTSSGSIFDWLKKNNTNTYDQEIRGVLGKMLFPKHDAFKPLKALSGGETARLLLSNLMLQAPNIIILDEPNNHLDLEAVSALTTGLREFPGTAIVASHDRDLVGGFADKIIALEDDGIHFFEGKLEDYLSQKV